MDKDNCMLVRYDDIRRARQVWNVCQVENGLAIKVRGDPEFRRGGFASDCLHSLRGA